MTKTSRLHTTWIRLLTILMTLTWISAAHAEGTAIELNLEGALGVATHTRWAGLTDA
jgi:hypothetical protein